MKFEVTHDKGTGVCTWSLLSNSGDLIASSSVPYRSVEDAETGISEFKKWVGQAHVEFITREAVKDWRRQAIDQLKKTPWAKG